MAEKQSAENQRSVDYALDVLEQFNGNVAEHSLTNLSKRLKINKNTVFRILTTLTSKHYIYRDAYNGLYRLGPKAVELGQIFKKQMGLASKARPVIEELVDKCNETAFFSIQKNYKLVFLDVVEANHAVKVVPRLGVPLPLYCTAAGKVILANMSRAELFEYISTCELKRYTPNTIIDNKELIEHISKVTSQGYAIDNEEFDSGVRCVGVALFDNMSKYIGAISVSGPLTRFSEQRIEMELIPLIKKTTKVLTCSHNLYFKFESNITTTNKQFNYYIG